MNRSKNLKLLTLAMLLFGFIAAGTLSSCRDQKKEEKTEHQEEHMEDGAVHDEHPTNDGEEHPQNEEHPKDSVSE